MNNYLHHLIARRRNGIAVGIPAFCTADELVIEACLEQAKRFDDHVLIEATANQVNQFGGYTGMKPTDFRDMVYAIADRVNFPRKHIILGGDHLGPLIWSNLDEETAMSMAIELVKEFTLAGFKKIHLDTSMRLASDSSEIALDGRTVARRGAILYQACQKAYEQLKKKNSDEIRPVYVIGSEVPIPGGSKEKSHIDVTKPESLNTILTDYQTAFEEIGYVDAFQDVIAVVVQPGVEFGDDNIVDYDCIKAHELIECVKKHEGIVLEGHSTDYQSAKALKKMVEDGIAILKVGPALTFALREGLYALSAMEEQLVPPEKRANFVLVLEQVMIENPENWAKYYYGAEDQLRLKRMYSYSDRCRYYFSNEKIVAAKDVLFANLDSVTIPMSMLHQYMPFQYLKVRNGKLSCTARELAKDMVVMAVEDYNFATKYNYTIAGIYI